MSDKPTTVCPGGLSEYLIGSQKDLRRLRTALNLAYGGIG